ncbi:MAG TPA: hydrogenase expression/formation protein HypE, partial [Dehalococcoidia bacterium]|nr:hydrogenase expression/formation protein HypE [Dehalococcoidia bacterium]
LVERLFLPAFRNPYLEKLDDQAVLTLNGTRLAFTTDSFVVTPIFFPGGDIGRLAVNGTINDLAMSGARPLYLSAAFILEEGLPLADLRRITASLKGAAREAGVKIVAGDTKVVERGSADGLFINTAGLGLVPEGVDISGSNARPGDAVILSGPIGNHGISVLLEREHMGFVSTVKSDVAPLNLLVAVMLQASPNIHALRDPTRGGLATSLVEMARQSGVAIRIHEGKVLIDEEVAAACEILGYDPLYVANEGKLIALVAPQDAPKVLRAMKESPYGRQATIIGEVLAEPRGRVLMATRVGGTRIVDMLSGEQFPRIC